MNKIENFRVFVNKVLPTVYDDSLSYYELLNKVVHYLNTTIDQVNNLSTSVGIIIEQVVPENVEQLLNEWYENGKLSELININISQGVKVGDAPKFGYVAVTGTKDRMDYHAFEDRSNLVTTSENLGYSSFDAIPTMNNDLQQDHFVGYQARQKYQGSGGLRAYMNGYDTDMEHSGLGLINEASGMKINAITGIGPISKNYGVYIAEINRGIEENYGIYSNNYKNALKGIQTEAIESLTSSLGINFGVDAVGKEIVIGYGNEHVNGGAISFYNGRAKEIVRISDAGVSMSNIIAKDVSFGINYGVDGVGKGMVFGYQEGANNFGNYVFYNGKTGRLAELGQNGLKLEKPLTVGSYTYETLPDGVNGAIAYCTNGRKASEGAGAGTGCMVYIDNNLWKSFETNVLVTN